MATIGEQARQHLSRIRKLREEALTLLMDTGYEDIAQRVLQSSNGKNREYFPLRCKTLKELRVAAIMDRFTLDSYAPECELLELTPSAWQQEIDSFQPDLVFIESAWKGKDDLWFRKIAHGSKEFFDMAQYCRSKKIPIIFWNKEDPIYTTTFLPVAHASDVVFTTDIDCVEQYKTALGHDRVYHLHFAAQPKLHNPIEKYDRKNKFCFAGAYYHRYPKRAEVFDAFAEVFERREGLDIYDRNYGNALPEHAFPERYNPLILGKLDPSEIDIAYKGYLYGINMNSVNQSQSMFARRVFEMLASNTITVGNYARGLKNYFGDLTLCTDDGHTLEEELRKYAGDLNTARRYRLAGLRCALQHHLYENRLAFIVSKVFGQNLLPELPHVQVITCAESEEAAGRAIRAFERQSYQNCSMTLFADVEQVANPHIRVLPRCDARGTQVGKLAGQGEFAAAFAPSDWYGENYLLDMMLTLRYSAYRGMGKASAFVMKDGRPVCEDREKAYRPAEKLYSTSAVLRDDVCQDTMIEQFCAGFSAECDGLFAVDEFNYCAGCAEDSCEEAGDLFIADKGISLAQMEQAAESIQMALLDEAEDALQIGKEKIAEIPLPREGGLRFEITHEGAVLHSTMPEGKHAYIFHSEKFDVSRYVQQGKLPVLFQGAGSMDLICVCIFYDKNGKKLAPAYPKLNRTEQLDIPQGAVQVQFGFRPKGSGKTAIQGIMMGSIKQPDRLAAYLSRSDTLVLTNHYPSAGDLYRNMFVHRRLLAYKDAGIVPDLFRMNIYAQDGYREFEGINVIEGHAEALDKVLRNGRIKTVCVHFLDDGMWSVLKEHLDHVQVIVWLHGADVRPWTRRAFDFVTEEEKNTAKAASDKRMVMWREVFEAAETQPVHFVFVSRIFCEEVMQDYGITLKPEQYSIIHNCIDTKLYAYAKKDAAQRKRILSIKTYASRSYATDITSKAIVELSKEPVFKDLDIHLYGDGQFFEKDNAPLKKFANVHLHQQFLKQSEIAQLHKEFGVFMATTRLDSQGVSRDEAMASGMVPVVNGVSAVPEFVDENCGMLVPPEDYRAVAQAIKQLCESETLFEKLSEGAAQRVRSQSDRAHTIDKEIELIRSRT